MTLSPLTADHARLHDMLGALQLDGRDDGTAIGSALMTGVRRLSQSPARSRVVLLLTDGSQNRGRVTPQDAALEAAGQGIRVYTVLMGRAGSESVYPIDGHFYRLRVEPDFETLREIARMTGGGAFSADDPAGLEHGLRAIDELEKTTLPIDTPTEGRLLARWLLMFSAAAALPLATDLARKRGQKPPGWLSGRGQ
jgi:Ca-activated chloride channel family protein